ncbi:glycosyltransferase [Pseudomonas reactans]|uniref:Glycosyltransferase n=1 Tax=Pseudomonas reactans TaxID=117680 RepID=A0A7Y8KK16_9PSED|nr:glycosyltransferase [Pseudomonas reactans]NWE91723.1 glycosyltransferase [Pseudomonas reactans]
MKLLLLTDIPPCRNFTAGLVLDRLVSFLPKDQLAICAVVNPALQPEIPAELDLVPKLLLTKPREASIRVLPRKAGVLSAFPYELLQAGRVRSDLLPKIVEFAKAQQVDAVWVVLQGQTMVRLARQLTKKLNVPLLTQVWDPFGWWLQANRIDGFTRRRLQKEFDDVLKESASCATASWAMSQNYTAKYNVANVPVIAGLPRELAREPAARPHERDDFVIAMAGQFYAQAEWQCLQYALNGCNWTVAGRRIRIRVLGGGFSAFTQSPANFEYLGWRSQEETISLLADADLLYMPYWFSEEYREESSNSFPSKLVTYFAAGRPVFCHAPAYASPARYVEANNAGYLCQSLDTATIVACLERVIQDEDTYGQYAANGRACFMRDFTLERMKESLLEFLGNHTKAAAGLAT